jgi:hypothetical protein
VRLGVRAAVERARRDEKLLASLAFEGAPLVERPLREPDVLLLRVGEPEDPRGAVARAAPVAELELLEDEYAAAGSRESMRRCEPGDAGADDRDVGLPAQCRSE